MLPYLHSRSHETRNAASVALSQICSLAPLWEPPEPDGNSITNEMQIQPEFPLFSIQQLMESNNRLLASSGKEFTKPTGIFQDAAEVRKARKAAMGRLGLDFLESVGDGDEMDIEKELAADEDIDIDAELKPGTTVKPEASNTIKIGSPVDPTHSFRAESVPDRNGSTPPAADDDLAGLSARERNRLKRKRKAGTSAFVAAPPSQSSNSKFNAAPANASGTKYVLTRLIRSHSAECVEQSKNCSPGWSGKVAFERHEAVSGSCRHRPDKGRCGRPKGCFCPAIQSA